MLRMALVACVVCGVGTASAADCTIGNARYKQSDAAWWLTFIPVPQFAAPNQTAAFYLELPNSGATLQGAVHRPNGFGSPLWTLSGPCAPQSAASCHFPEEGSSPAIYGDYQTGVAFLVDGRGAAAPAQVVLPGLAESLWYSQYREDEFVEGAEPGDAFQLVGCD
jgi:hypothetical protein